MRLASLCFQIALLIAVIERFELASPAFFRLSLLAGAGFVVHALLPARFRLPFFAALSLAGIPLVLGLVDGAWLVGTGLALVAICHLPGPLPARVALLAAAGAGLALARHGGFEGPWPAAIWPILGSMFMFRLIIYVYDLRRERAPSLPATLAYFFMLPNVCFPFFPVVDYRTFRRTHYDAEDFAIYQRGAQLMALGVFHLLLYRAVYYHATLAPNEVTSSADLARFLAANYLLYLRVSGVFHLVAGMLHLFGFNLPETNRYFLLASSINDFWRRINIYWKDFMLKVFYNPSLFRLRRYGNTLAVALSTVLVAVMTWLLHSYQWFWLRGSFPIRWQDLAFWGSLGVVMVANSLYELRARRTRARGAATPAARAVLGRLVRTAATFGFICLIWSVWTASTLSDWVGLWVYLLDGSAGDALRRLLELLALLALASVAMEGIGALMRRAAGEGEGRAPAAAAAPWRVAAVTALPLALLLGVGSVPTLGSASQAIASLREARLSRVDATRLQRGYYENLLDVGAGSELSDSIYAQPADWVDLGQAGATRDTGDFRLWELRPGLELVFKRAPMRVNAWGMRDAEYALAKPPGTTRIAMVGSSIAMGSAVANDETFEARLEERLNRDPAGRYEVLNFAVGGYSPLHRLLSVELQALEFDPDAVLYVAHETEANELLGHLVRGHLQGVEVPYAPLARALREAAGGAAPETGGWLGPLRERLAKLTLKRRLEPRGEELLAWTYRRLVELCRERGIAPVWIYLPTIEWHGLPTEEATWARLAEEAGFRVIRLSELWDGRDLAALRVAPWDQHPNAAGHQLIADALYRELRDRDVLVQAR